MTHTERISERSPTTREAEWAHTERINEMSMTFMAFQKELQNRGIDGQTAYMLSLIYEQHIEVVKQVDAMATIIDALANTVGNVVELHRTTADRLVALKKMMTGEVDGVFVTSEPGKGN